MVILHKVDFATYSHFKLSLIKTFEEEAPIVAKYLRFNQDDVRYFKRCHFHQNTFSLSKRSRYCP